MKFKIGDYVKVSECSGIDSGKIGVIVNRSKVKTNYRGVPTNIMGCYKPVDWTTEVAIKVDETNELITMFKNRIAKL